EGGSPEDTDLERISLAGPRIKDLGQVVRDREWCPNAITNSLSVNHVRVSLLLTQLRRSLSGRTLCQSFQSLASPHRHSARTRKKPNAPDSPKCQAQSQPRVWCLG